MEKEALIINLYFLKSQRKQFKETGKISGLLKKKQ